MSDEAKHREIVRKAMKRARPELPKDPTDTQWGFADAREAFVRKRIQEIDEHDKATEWLLTKI